MNKKIVVIAAVAASDNLMGATKDGKDIIPWYCSEDFKHFKEITKGSAIIMGRKTLESLPGILPERVHIYLSRSISSRTDAYRVSTFEEAIEVAYKLSGSEAIFIIGGAQIIELALQADIVDEIILTKIFASLEEVENPVYFPTLSQEWVGKEKEIISSQKCKPENLKYQIIHYEKRKIN